MIATTREWVSRHGWTIRRRCLKCGRDKIEDTGSNSHDTSPLQTGEKIRQEERMGKKGICTFAGCDKRILAGGYCYRHYKEVNGHPYKGGQKNHKGGNIKMPERGAVEKTPAQADPVPLFRIFLDPELLDKLTAAAKREYRTPELHAAYLIEKALQEKADGTYQSGSGRRGG
jgi:hypothetical protein